MFLLWNRHDSKTCSRNMRSRTSIARSMCIYWTLVKNITREKYSSRLIFSAREKKRTKRFHKSVTTVFVVVVVRVYTLWPFRRRSENLLATTTTGLRAHSNHYCTLCVRPDVRDIASQRFRISDRPVVRTRTHVIDNVFRNVAITRMSVLRTPAGL